MSPLYACVVDGNAFAAKNHFSHLHDGKFLFLLHAINFGASGGIEGSIPGTSSAAAQAQEPWEPHIPNS